MVSGEVLWVGGRCACAVRPPETGVSPSPPSRDLQPRHVTPPCSSRPPAGGAFHCSLEPLLPDFWSCSQSILREVANTEHRALDGWLPPPGAPDSVDTAPRAACCAYSVLPLAS